MPEYDVFVSHSSKDKNKARSIAQDLEEQGYTVWFDTVEIESGEDWVDEIQIGLDASASVVVVWTDNAASSKWVKNELARADQNNTPIIPLRFDDTPIDIIIQRIQHIDFQRGYFTAFPRLISRLQVLINREISPKSDKVSWRREKRPFYRSEFLEQNNYRDLTSENFMTNNVIESLRNVRNEGPLASWVIIPVPIDLDIDLTLANTLLGISKQHNHIELGNQSAFKRFRLSNFIERARFREKIYRLPHNPDDINYFLRIKDDGSIEYVHTEPVYPFETADNINRYIFDFMALMGISWKIAYLAGKFYKQAGYTGSFQFILSLRQTKGNMLGHFAKSGNKRWPSVTDNFGRGGVRYYPSLEGISETEKMQFIYTLNFELFTKFPTDGLDWIKDLSKNLQQGFSYKPKMRHLIPDTDEFDWRTYQEYARMLP